MVENNPDRCLSLRWSLSLANANMADCENIIRCAINLNHDLCREITNCHGSRNVFSSSRHVLLLQQANVFNLMEPQEIQINENIKMNSLFVKQRSEEWFAIHKQTKVTGSSIGKGIGLQGLAQKKYIMPQMS